MKIDKSWHSHDSNIPHRIEQVGMLLIMKSAFLFFNFYFHFHLFNLILNDWRNDDREHSTKSMCVEWMEENSMENKRNVHDELDLMMDISYLVFLSFVSFLDYLSIWCFDKSNGAFTLQFIFISTHSHTRMYHHHIWFDRHSVSLRM